MNRPNDPEILDAEPVENPSMELARVTSEGDPESMLATLEKKAQLAPRMNAAINAILVSQTYPEDWTEQGGKMCLSSAGAERVARMFAIRFFESHCRKEEFADGIGKAYRYIYECRASLGDREVFAQGAYSTRDKFLGFANQEWRPSEDINENNIRNAAYHICLGNAVKALLGLRGIPAERFRQIMGKAGEDATKAASVHRGAGTQGGTSADDSIMQKELAELCIKIAAAGKRVAQDDKGYWVAEAMDFNDERPNIERAMEICISLSGFTGKDGKVVAGRLASQLMGGRLKVTLGTARKVVEQAGL